eukprot:UN23932
MPYEKYEKLIIEPETITLKPSKSFARMTWTHRQNLGALNDRLRKIFNNKSLTICLFDHREINQNILNPTKNQTRGYKPAARMIWAYIKNNNTNSLSLLQIHNSFILRPQNHHFNQITLWYDTAPCVSFLQKYLPGGHDYWSTDLINEILTYLKSSPLDMKTTLKYRGKAKLECITHVITLPPSYERVTLYHNWNKEYVLRKKKVSHDPVIAEFKADSSEATLPENI